MRRWQATALQEGSNHAGVDSHSTSSANRTAEATASIFSALKAVTRLSTSDNATV